MQQHIMADDEQEHEEELKHDQEQEHELHHEEELDEGSSIHHQDIQYETEHDQDQEVDESLGKLFFPCHQTWKILPQFFFSSL